MNICIFKFIPLFVLLTAALTSSAQKNYSEGTITYTAISAMESNEYKISFRNDTNIVISHEGPALIKRISNIKETYLTILMDVPAAEWKRAAILTPDEINQVKNERPNLTFMASSETKQIGNYSCKRVIAKDTKTGVSFDVWITNDITAPVNSFNISFANAGGFPVQFTMFQSGQKTEITLKDITAEKLPSVIFNVPTGYDHVTYSDIKQ